MQGRRVRLVVRRVEPWTVLKFSVLLFATLYLVFLVAGLVLWTAATATGLRENIEKFIGDLIASDDFKILGPTMLRASVLGGLVLVILGTGANVLMAVVYNLISDVIGGITVVFEERPTRRRLRAPIDPDGPPPALKPARAPRKRVPRPVLPDTTPMPDLPGEPVDVTRRPAD
ncbi:MAG TPA: DUF3566 domain-containing protein [Acidimicrobiales bacterium]|nr:DUF3566 domain-containing protein [Acidimicrobiales bacterium]